MNTLEEILSKLSGKLSELKEEYNVRTIGVFGSYATNSYTENSDVDILGEISNRLPISSSS
ncbi:nucleotidyltransferase family protein [Mesotoga sp.]|uniref:nucleotidyltransferase family protein n=1 Tax=Mesotoga sp. TaxID=2053577 RepID=UPI00345E5724